MREIKFRAWDKEIKTMCYGKLGDDRWYSKTGFLDVSMGGLSSCEIMQYTGLKDKNGREIYEGDIVELFDRDGRWEVKISSRDGIGFWKQEFQLGDNNHSDDPVYIDWDKIEIIGNIYENKELLTL